MFVNLVRVRHVCTDKILRESFKVLRQVLESVLVAFNFALVALSV
jgi:hypothetical protein